MANRKTMNEQQIGSLCDVVAHTSNGLTKSEITHLLRQCNIEVAEDGSGNGSFGLSKRKWLYNCFANHVNTKQSYEAIFSFIEKALSPVAYTAENKRTQYAYLFEEVNKVLLMLGLEVTKSGNIQETHKSTTLDEVDRRVNELQAKLYHRAIHEEVRRYCVKDYLRKDYYDAVFEASKSLAQRVRELSGLTSDGSQLYQTAFAKSNPYIVLNTLQTESEINEFNGLKELLEAVTHLVRNPAAHTPKIDWKTDEAKTLDILTVISFAHKYLDICYKMPGR